LAHHAYKKRKAPAGPSSAQHRGIVLCRMPQLHFLRRPLSKGIGLFDLLSSSNNNSSSLGLYHHSSSIPAQGRKLSKQLILTTTTTVSSVGARVTLLRCAPKRDNPRGRLSTEKIKTKPRSRLSKLGRADSTSPVWLIFLREHR
jgi:hypothetical protein